MPRPPAGRLVHGGNGDAWRVTEDRWVQERRRDGGAAAAARISRFRPLELVVLAAPFLWVVLAILHPGGGEEPPEGIADQANKWIFVHVGQLVLTPFLAAGVWMLLDGIQSVAALDARAALVVWMVFFSAFDAIAGVAVGVLTRHANSLAAEERETLFSAINFLFTDS